jgi:hypothetical protein
MHTERVDLVIRYALAIAREGDFGERELGEIHLLKYVYLADLAHAEANAAETFTGAPWRFFKFGPWAQEVLARIRPVIGSLDVEERVFSSAKFEGEGVRKQLLEDDDQVIAQLERQLPSQVKSAVRAAVRRYGDDTSELLHHVYATRPMLYAAPNEMLAFKVSESRPPYQKPADEPLTERQKKKRRETLEATRQALRARLDAAKAKAVPAIRRHEFQPSGATIRRGLQRRREGARQ